MANPLSIVTKPILDEIIKTTFDLIKEITYPLILDKIIKATFDLIKETYSSDRGVMEDVKNLSRTLSAIKAVLEDAENKQVTNPQLKDWLGKLNEAALDAMDILETSAAEAHQWKKRQRAVRKASSKYDTAQKIKDISKRFDVIAEEKNKFHLAIQVNGGGLTQDKTKINIIF
jgi:hypothetical protein